MPLFQNTSIKRKMIAINLLIVGTALLLTSGVMTIYDFINYRRSLIDDLTVQAKIIGNNSTAAMAFNDPHAAIEILAALRSVPNIVYAVIYTSDGRAFADYQRGTIQGDVVPLGPQKEGYHFSLNSLSLYHRIVLDGETMGTLYINSDLEKLYSRLQWRVATLIIVLALSFGIALLLSSKLQRAITVPIFDLVRLMSSISKNKNYSEQAVPHSRDELGTLAEGFNEMLGQIKKRDTELEQHRKHLEDLVTMRAAELAKTNEELQRELAERKKAEERLNQYARELKENNEELKTFAYIASHDLRTPLVNMRGFAGELRYALQEINAVINEFLPSLGDNNRAKLLTAFLKDVPEALGFIDSSAGRMEELVNAISKLSRLGLQELKPELIQVQTIVQSVLKDLQLVIEKNGIRVNVGPLPEIVADRNSLQMIFGSILNNAVKYLRPGVPGEIRVTAETGPEGTVFSIRDNGRGIPNDDIPKVFEMFRQVGEQDTPGEGVGLASAKTLVKRHGGRIWCESAPGVGTTFHVMVPEKMVDMSGSEIS